MQHRRAQSDHLNVPKSVVRQTSRNLNSSRLRLSQIIHNDTDLSISEEPEYFLESAQTTRNHDLEQQPLMNRSFSHQTSIMHNNHNNWVADDEYYSNFQEVDQQALQHRKRRDSVVTQTNLAMCRPNQCPYVDYSSASYGKGSNLDLQVWEKLDASRFGELPTPRNSCSWVTHENQLLIFGGFTFNGRLDDVYSFNFSTQMWTRVQTFGQKPKARENNGAQVYDGNMFVFGGYDGNSWLNDLYMLSLSTYMWTKVEQKGQQPSERFGFASGFHDNVMTIFGGFDGNTQLNDAFSLNLDECVWSKLELQGDLPAPRSCPSFASQANNLFIFGGFDGINRLNDFYKINMHSGKVSRISQHGSIPCPRYFHSSQIYTNKLILFGGYNGHIRLNDLYEFDFARKEWMQLDVQDPPQGRSSMVFQIYNDSIYTFGGYNGFDVLNDFYRMPFRNALVPKSTFLVEQESLINNPEFSDVVFLVEGKEIHANRAILGVRSQHFKALLFDGFRESETKQKHSIKIQGVSHATFIDMLKYLYTDLIDPNLTLKRLINLIMLADQYMLERLKFLCEERVTKMVDVDNVIDVVLLATRFNSLLVKNRCMRLLEQHISTLKRRKDFSKLMAEPEILMEIIQRKC